MRPISLTLQKIRIQKIKIQRRVWIGGIIVVLVILAIVGLGYLQKSGKLGEINWGLLLAKLTQLPKREEEAVPAEEIKIEEEEEEEVPSAPGKTYEKTAEPGEGITHLARKALKEYLATKETQFNLTPEHKIYIEDYIQNKTGERWLSLGEKITISEDLIGEAINKAQQLTPEQLENLKQYSAQVPSL